MKRAFNTTGPCVPGEHYMLPPEDRCPGASALIEGRHFFILHAARQTGKTTLLNALESKLNAAGRYHALYCSLESVQGIDDAQRGIPAVMACLTSAMKYHPNLKAIALRPQTGEPNVVLKDYLTDLCAGLDRPLVVFFDETDCLSEGTLISFLRQLRDGYVNRGRIPFVHSLALVGMRNIRDYKARVRDERSTLGSASPFNIAVESLTLRNFTRDEVRALYDQHTGDTGQKFPPEVVDAVHARTLGQPWLVNAVAREIVVKLLENDPSRPILPAMAEEAIERIIRRRDTHIDSLLERLKEERVRRIIEPLLLGEGEQLDRLSDDFEYVSDLGLIREEKGTILPGNSIYGEVMARTLNHSVQASLSSALENRWMDGRTLDMSGLLREFQAFWRENSEAWVERFDYREAAPHLILMAYLQRVLNGGARLDREFATGTRRVDLCVDYAGRRYPVELKLVRGPKTRDEGLEQLAAYCDQLGAREGWLALFDRSDKPWDEKIRWETLDRAGRTLHVAGC